MPTPRKSKQKRLVLDRVDAEQIRETLQTRGWKLIAARIQHMRQVKLLELEQDQGETNTALIRGYLEALRAVGSIPDILMREGMKAPAAADDDEG
jgi:hypothetical protein